MWYYVQCVSDYPPGLFKNPTSLDLKSLQRTQSLCLLPTYPPLLLLILWIKNKCFRAVAKFLEVSVTAYQGNQEKQVRSHCTGLLIAHLCKVLVASEPQQTWSAYGIEAGTKDTSGGKATSPTKRWTVAATGNVLKMGPVTNSLQKFVGSVWPTEQLPLLGKHWVHNATISLPLQSFNVLQFTLLIHDNRECIIDTDLENC